MKHRRNKMALVRAAALCLGATALLSTGWQLFKKPDPDVERGNKLIRKNKPTEALKAYQKAEKRLGRRARLDYNRGLAHFGKNELKKAREAFLAATGATDKQLRKNAFYNLANTMFRQAKPTIKAAQKAADAVKQAEAAINQLSGESQKQQRCKAMAGAAKVFKTAVEKNQAVMAAFKEALNEYRLVLVRDPKHYNAKWNLELCLRYMGAAKRANKRLTDRAKELAERFKKECKPPEDKNKKKNKQQNKQNQNKQNQNKQQQKQQQNKQNQNKQQQKQQQNKQNQNKQQQKQQQNKQNQNKQNPSNPKQKPLSKEDIAKRKAGKKLDRLERKQRDRDRQRDRGRTTRRPLKDW